MSENRRLDYRRIFLRTIDGEDVPFAEASIEDFSLAKALCEHGAFCAETEAEREDNLRAAAAFRDVIEELFRCP